MSGDDLDRALERARQANERVEAASAASSAASEELLRKRETERTQFEAFISSLAKELSATTTKLDQSGIPRISLDRPLHPGPPAANLEMKKVIGSMSILGKLSVSESSIKLEIDWDKPIQIGSLDIPDVKYPVGSVEPKQVITAMIDAYTKAINQRASS
ncbi:hypothetical protein [Rhizobium leguminosarum]|uniref:hypothetical protein n=1 Tax=Rhizobium leguminosarum TaxID=384 RepID=UPI00103B145F|nr:hypothetical protein [Rhizobium leguminosarum]TBZ09435.1 hypothetical protein E0H33_25435 [Rhizobium leguminosarum bv. viciae]